jgi:hypothetical protein
MVMALIVGVLVALTVGFLAGLLTFRAKQRWCGVCGGSLVCPVHGNKVPAARPTQ